MAKNNGVMFYDEFSRSAEPVGQDELAQKVQLIDLDSVASLPTFTAYSDALHRSLVASGAIQE